jgi:hypothetical protein
MRSFRALYDAERRRPLSFLSTAIPLPRHRIFYNAKYEKTIGLPKKHPLRKVLTIVTHLLRIDHLTVCFLLMFQNASVCEALVDTVFLPGLALLEYPDAKAMRKALIRLFKAVRRAYRKCAMGALMEKHCSLADMIKNAQSLVEPDPSAAEAVDMSALFATPASRPSMDVCGSTGSARSARSALHKKPESSSTGNLPPPLQHTGTSQTLSWRGTASTTNSSMNMTLTTSSSTEQDVAVTCSMDCGPAPSSATGAAPPALPASPPHTLLHTSINNPFRALARRVYL